MKIKYHIACTIFVGAFAFDALAVPPSGTELLKDKYVAKAKTSERCKNDMGNVIIQSSALCAYAVSAYTSGRAYRCASEGKDLSMLMTILAINVGILLPAYFSQDYIFGSSRRWASQLERLVSSGRIANTIMKVGIPSDWRGYTKLLADVGVVDVVYLLVRGFDDINNAYTGDHYEVYVNPTDDSLIDVFLKVCDLADAYKNNIAFLAVRPTPGMSRSRLNGKYLPRILIGFNNAADKTRVAEFISQLKDLLKQEKGIGYRPQYSDEVEGTNKLIYVSKGSGDYKESAQGQKEYAPMEYTPETFWSRLRSKLTNNPDVEDMAYPDEQSRIEILPPLLNRWAQ